MVARRGWRGWRWGRPRGRCGARRGAASARGLGQQRCRDRSARRRGSGRASQIVSGPVVSPACGTECRPAARAASKYGANCSRPTPISGPPSPKEISPAGWRSVAMRRVSSAAGSPNSPGMSKHHRSSSPKSRAAATLASSMACTEGLGSDPRQDRGVRRAGQLGVADLLVGHVPRHLVRQQPDILGGPHQADDRQEDLDEMGEVGEGEEAAERIQVARHAGGRVSLRPARPRPGAGQNPRGEHGARPSGVQR